MDARYSCPASTTCAPELKCVSADGSSIDGIANLDAFEVAEFQDFGKGMVSRSNSICGVFNGFFRIPNFCGCRDVPLGGEVHCRIGVANIAEVGARIVLVPCGRPATFGYQAWAQALGVSKSISNTWQGAFNVAINIPGVGINIGIASAQVRAEVHGSVSGGVLHGTFAIGACGSILGIRRCNPFGWLPVTVVQGAHDFSRFC